MSTNPEIDRLEFLPEAPDPACHLCEGTGFVFKFSVLRCECVRRVLSVWVRPKVREIQISIKVDFA